MSHSILPPTVPARIAIVATLRWTFGARLAMAFRDLGCSVDSWCPRGHPLDSVQGLGRRHRAPRLAAQASLRTALMASAPDLAVACDDESTRLLRCIHDECRPAAREGVLRSVLDRSLGSPDSCGRAADRGALLRLARSLGVRTPMSASVGSPEALADWAAERGFPAVLKSDRSWGGRGVTVLRGAAELAPAFRRARRAPWKEVLSDWLLRRDPAPLLDRLFKSPPALTVQDYVRGRAANRAVACWRGEILGGLSVEALQTQGPAGPASVVRVIENAEMTEAARRIVGALGLSGFCGLDFILEAGSGRAELIELNPRATPVCHLGRAGAPSLPALLLGRLRHAPVRDAPEPHRGAVVAIFPGEWSRDPCSRWLVEAFHDVPWGEPALVRDALRGAWETRGLAARLRARFRAAARPAETSAAGGPAGRVAPSG